MGPGKILYDSDIAVAVSARCHLRMGPKGNTRWVLFQE